MPNNNDAINVDNTEEPPLLVTCYFHYRHRFPESEMVETHLGGGHGTVVLCPDCADNLVTCEMWGCGNRIAEFGGYVMNDGLGERYCETCWDEHTYYCEGCGEDHWSEDGPCENGYDEGGLMSYDYKPAPVFFGTGPAFLGLELEMEAEGNMGVSEAVGTIADAFGDRFYCKHDGSLCNGLEMVSHPMGLDAWQKIEDDLTAMLKRLRRGGVRSWNTDSAGIHIHISANAFVGERHVWLFQQMFYRNRQAIVKFAGRSSHWSKLDMDKGGVGKATKMHKDGQGYGTDRYMAVNLQNRSTLEVRVFRGSLNPTRVLANLEFVAGLHEYTSTLRYCDVKDGGLDFAVFAFWLAKQGKKYAHASALIKARFAETSIDLAA